MSLFASTASYYRRYRAGVPDELVAILASIAPQGTPRRILDVGTGPGFVVDALLPHFDEAIGVDPDPDLLTAAREDVATRYPDKRVEFVQAAAEDFAPDTGWQAHLVTVCRAFHWFNRPRFLARARGYMAPGAVIAVFADQSIWAGGDEWKTRTQQVVRSFLGEERRAGDGTYTAPTHDFADDLRDSGLTDVTTQIIPVTRKRSVTDVVGLMHSMSFASPAVLGDRIHAFDKALAAALAPLADDAGLLTDNNRFTLHTGRLA